MACGPPESARKNDPTHLSFTVSELLFYSEGSCSKPLWLKRVTSVCLFSVNYILLFSEWLFSILKRWFVAYFFFYKWNEGGKICKSMFQNKNKQYFFFRENLKETSLKKSHALCRKIYPAPYFWVGLNGCSCPFESLYF